MAVNSCQAQFESFDFRRIGGGVWRHYACGPLCEACLSDRFGELRRCAWRYRVLVRPHQGVERHKAWQLLVAEVETLRLAGESPEDLHQAVSHLLQYRV